MMANPKQMALIQHLHERSLDGTLEWTDSIIRSAFEVSLSNYTIRVSMENDDYRVNILDGQGRTVESFTDVDLDKGAGELTHRYYKMLSEIYDMARRIAYGVDEALNNILDELKKGKIPF